MNIPERKWTDIGIDFIVGLPMTKNHHDAIMTVVDRCTKMVHLVPTATTVSAPRVAKLFVTHIWRLHGVPSSIVSDRDVSFVSLFCKNLMELLGTKLRMSTAFYP